MLVCCWSPKGGTGTTVVAAALALVLARRAAHGGAGALLVDLGGDASSALGVSGGDGPGVLDWLAAAPDVPSDALARLEVDVAPGLRLVPTGDDAPTRAAAGALLAGVLGADPRSVVVDCGRLGDAGPGECPASAVVAAADRSLVVLRPCFLGLRRAAAARARATDVVVVDEPGRALSVGDVPRALGLPLAATVRVTDRVARAVDAGLLNGLPRSLAEDLRGLA